ncbi:MAG: F0F1 ATP synthase subunit B [Lachnospiraceae bacterium]|nr:F0F1 ATP synthase subunit B [Lachnospiraceae bacterium]
MGNLLKPVLLDAATETGDYGTRIFGLDSQLIFDAVVLAINIFILFILLSYFLFNPVRDMLKKRQDKITEDRENAARDKADAKAFKEEYDEKLKGVNKEVEAILAAARKKALENEERIISEAKEEAARIIEHARNEAELEKRKAADDVKKEIIKVSTLMAGKVVAASIDEKKQEELINQTLGEIGDSTWLS